MKFLYPKYKTKYKDVSNNIYIISMHLVFAFSLIFLAINIINNSSVYAIADKVILLLFSFIGLRSHNKAKTYLPKTLIILYILIIVLPLTQMINNFTHFYTLIFIILFSFFLLSMINEKFAIIVSSLCLVEYLVLLLLNARYPIWFSNINVKKSDALLFQPIALAFATLMLLILFYNYHKNIKTVDKLNKQLAKDSKLNNMLLNLTYLATKDNDIESILNYILNETIDIVENAEKGSIIKNVDGTCKYISVSGYDIDMLNKIKMPINNSHLYQLTDGKMDKTVLIDEFEMIKNSYKIDNFNDAGFNYRASALTSPIYVDNKIWGIVTIDSYQNTTFNSSDFKIIEILSSETAKLISFSLLLTDNENLKNRDPLTHLYNRRCFTDIFKSILAYEKTINLTLIAIDLDNLKKINDNYGHANGDKYIKKLAKALDTFFDDKSIISRYGGDEFFILLKNKSTAHAKTIIDKIKSHLNSTPLEIGDERIVVDFSYGIIKSDSSKKFKDIMALADYEMYSNKHFKKAVEMMLSQHND